MAKKTTKKTPSRKTTKKTPSRKTAKKKTAKKKTTKKKTTKKKTTKKKTTKKKTTKKKTTKKKCAKKCTKKKCASKITGGHSLVDRARECQNLEECRRFIVEMGEAIDQSNDWLNDMHSQALSAEQARDVYGEQISDLVEAIDLDKKRIAELEAELKKAQRGGPKSSAAQTVLRKLTEMDKEVRTIRTDLKRLIAGREPSGDRRRQLRKTKAAKTKATSRSRSRSRSSLSKESAGRATPRRATEQTIGPFAKYSVLRGAACSLGVRKHGYPPEVCAPASFPPSVAAEILGTYAQNDYSGLARWALVTGLPIDDMGIEAPSPKAKRKSRAKNVAGGTASKKRQTTSSKKATKSRAKTSQSPSPPTSRPASDTSDRNSTQVLDRVLLTIARI